MSSYFRQQLEQWLKTIDVKADRVLDVGGAANPVKGRTKSWEVKEYLIADNGLEGGKGHIGIDFNLIPKYEEYEQYGEFDVTFCLEVFEYIYVSFHALQTIKWFLKSNGLLYISFPFLYPQHNPVKHDYLRYTKAGAIKLLTEVGFKIIECVPRVQKGGLSIQSWYASEKMHPAKQEADHNEIGYLITAKKIR